MNVKIKHNHYDLADVRIDEGSFVAYAASWGRCPVLKYGIVTRLAERKDWRSDDPIPTIRVISVDRNEKWDQGKKLGVAWEVQKKGQEMALGFLDRLLVVTTLPAGAKAALQKAYKARIDAASE